MASHEEVYKELKGRTGLNPDIEDELCRRISVIENSDGEIVPHLTKGDWIATWALIIVAGIIPILVEAFRYGLQ
ncbi:hypothetical protein NE619_00430 [Anaerovorax odorimutans]|uniref:Uncharacterized protein n=1 Tax=Anaerovorax odorimutans TaxID=109327 RepID=A0ABT1RJ37_9FIRM|nr:hypothetical protein [Anaerovorax odorimutans]MCQ4635198.1 hypothetical protein [Anaerovorax odorimutans]